jgi:phasin family protein
MADVPDPSAKSAEKAYAEAAAEAKPVEAKEPKAETPPEAPAPVQSKAPESAPVVVKTRKAPSKKRAAKSRTAKPAAKPARAPARARAAKPAVQAAKVPPAPVKQAPPKTFAAIPTLSELKDKIMATAKTTDFTKPINEAIGEFQTRAKEAYEKSTEALTEATEFAKGNVEAIVESGKILAGGAQDLGKSYVEEAKSAYETLTSDIKELAAVKSPTELFQLQGKIARRNFDAMVAASSKNTEAMIKLAGEAFAPLSGRVNVAAEKLTQAAA